jgi:23S rRNA U2552 (ribose-2'-O)-methylase RlmE/FtsJ
MDPTELVCLVYDSFFQQLPSFNEDILPKRFSTSGTLALTPTIERSQLTNTSNLPPNYVGSDLFNLVSSVKDLYSHPNIREARDKTNPFEELDRSKFFNRAGLKMANIDAIYHLTGHITGPTLNQDTDSNFHYLDLASGPGAFAEYLQWRRPTSQGFGMTLSAESSATVKNQKLDWKVDRLDLDRFKILYGSDNTGNLYTNWDWLINFVLSQGDGIDLVTADGGFDVESSPDYSRQEYLTSRLLLTELLIAISCCQTGGNIMIKVFDTVTSISAQTLFLAACCFESISLFKPISSRPANSERYLIGWSRRSPDLITPYVSLLREVINYYGASGETTSLINSFIGEDLPDDFVSWLVSQNTISFNRQLQAGIRIARFIYSTPQEWIAWANSNNKGDISSWIGLLYANPIQENGPYNLRAATIAWNIPDGEKRNSRLLIRS